MLSKLLKSYLSVNLQEMRPTGFDERRRSEIGRCVENVRTRKGTRFIEACPICCSTDREVVFRRFDINILQCRSCSLGYSEEFPMDPNDIYSTAEYLPIAKTDYLQNVSYRKKRFGKERLEIIERFLHVKKEEADLLDVGCGTGWFIDCAKDAGFNPSGQEIGRELAEFAREYTGVNVVSVPVVDLPPIPLYDVITMFDVLEHLPNPEQVLQHLFQLIKPGGVLLFFAPNLDSLGFKLLGGRSSLCMPVEHLFYFTEQSIVPVLNRLGFKVEMFETKGLDVADLYSYYRDIYKNQAVASFLEEVADVLQPIIDSAGCANHMRVLVRKPEVAPEI
jgi:SAM-dependent methyltransferase